MNYQELLDCRHKELVFSQVIPLGKFGRRMEGKKYFNVVMLRNDLAADPKFLHLLDVECSRLQAFMGKGQIRFAVSSSVTGRVELFLESGSFISFEQYLKDVPSAVARKHFVDNVISSLFRTLAALHNEGIFHVCLSPSNVFVRKGDDAVMLLSHGSFYLGYPNQRRLYEGFEDYVAPEVLNAGTVDARCDIYSLGRFFSSLLANTEMSYAYKCVIRKATKPMPEDRFQSIDDMAQSLRSRQTFLRTVFAMAFSLVMAACCVWGYFEFVPNAENIEYVKPAPKEDVDDLLDKGFDETTEFGVGGNDTISPLTSEERREMAKYEAKCEEIFKKQYEKEADRILSKVYNSSSMSGSQKAFVSGSRSMTEELVKAQMEIGRQAGLTDTKSQRLATDIVERLTEQKKAQLRHYGVQK